MLALALVLAASGCSRVLGLPDRHLDREPEGSELVGSWRLTAGSLARLEREGFPGREHALELDPSGRCGFRSFWALGTPAAEYLADPACAWRVARGTAYVRHRLQVVGAEQGQKLVPRPGGVPDGPDLPGQSRARPCASAFACFPHAREFSPVPIR